MKTIWGPSRPGKAKEIFFTLLYKGHRIAPTLVLKYHRILWLAQLCRTRGAGQITAQAIGKQPGITKGLAPLAGPYIQRMNAGGWPHRDGGDGREKRPPPPLWRQEHSEARGT